MMRKDWGPSVQIFEIDRSQYSKTLTGTRVMVFGFAAKGEDYSAQEVTSVTGFINTFGEPTNEAERYFYNACKEVIQQNGILYACKLPYKNIAHDRYVVQEYQVGAKAESLSSLANLAEDFSEFFDGDWTKFGYTKSSDSDDPDVVAFRNIDDIYQDIIKFNAAADARAINVPFYYLKDLGMFEQDQIEEDNWVQVPVAKIYRKLKALFGYYEPLSVYNEETNKIEVQCSRLSALLKAHELTAGTAVGPNFTVLNDYIDEHGLNSSDKVKDYLLAFHEIYLEMFGPEDTDIFRNVSNPSYEPSLNTISNDFKTPFFESNLGKFIKDNEEFFAQFDEVPLSKDAEEWENLVPYVFVDEDKFNLGPYFLVSKIADKLDNAEAVLNSDGMVVLMKKLLKLNEYFVQNGITNLEAPLEYFKNYFAGHSDPSNRDIIQALLVPETEIRNGKEKKVSVNDRICNIKDAFTEIMQLPQYASLASRIKDGIWSDTQFAKKAIQYYINHTVIYGNNDKARIQKATNFNVFSHTYSSDERDAELTDVTYFERYNGETSSAPEIKTVYDLIKLTLKEVTLEELCSYSKEIYAYTVESEEKPMLSDWINSTKDSFDTYCYREKFARFVPEWLIKNFSFGAIKRIDESIDQFIRINPKGRPYTISIEDLDGYSTGEQKVRQNTVLIVDKTRGTYGKSVTGKNKDIIGILPVITTAANALHYQNMLEDSNAAVALNYQAVGGIRSLAAFGLSPDDDIVQSSLDTKEANGILLDTETAIPFRSGDPLDVTVSTRAVESFPVIAFKEDAVLDREHLKKIGVVVFKMYINPTEGNRIDYEPVEAYVGELDPSAKNPATKVSTFIDTIVNSQSDYIELYSNCLATQSAKTEYQDKADILILFPDPDDDNLIFAGSLGFYDIMTKKDISVSESILRPLDKIWTNNSDVNEKDIDIIVDAGISNIAQYIKTVYGDYGKGEYDPASVEASVFKLKNEASVKTWRAVISKYDNFCKNIRRDCMFICDGPRPFCLVGNKKIVRKSKPTNTIDANLIPNLKYMGGINTSYGAGYCDWFEMVDDYSGDDFWCPPSIKAAGIYIYTDINAHYWDAPAGLNRGIINGVNDVAFSPTPVQSGQIYNKTWNYAINYPNEGIVLEGQKTCQVKPSALDRVNVRRLCLRLERYVYQTSRWFLYEPNNALTRQRLYDALYGEFKRVQGLGGIEDFKIIIDESINTPEVINNNELRVRIGIIPVKTIEWILVEFVVSKTGQSWEEAFKGL